MTEWQEDILDQIKFGKREIFYVVSPSQTYRNTFLAEAYKRADAAGIQRIKVVCPSDRVTVKFFDAVLPEHGMKVDFFALVNNTAMEIKEADVILFDTIDLAKTPHVLDLVEAVLKSGAVLIATAEKALPGQPMTEPQKDVLSLLSRLRPRYFTSSGEIKK